MGSIFKLENVSKSFSDIENRVILNNINFSLLEGESIAIVGESGSGKSTLLQICGLLDTPSSGNIFINDKLCNSENDTIQTLIRRDNIGFIYQFHHLLSEFNVLENLVIPQQLKKYNNNLAFKKKALDYLEYFNLSDKQNAFIHQLSGGEKQRIAIIRSIINDPILLLADEPTGSLDDNNSLLAFNIMQSVVKRNQAGLLIATHNLELASMCSRIMILEGGNLSERT